MIKIYNNTNVSKFAFSNKLDKGNHYFSNEKDNWIVIISIYVGKDSETISVLKIISDDLDPIEYFESRNKLYSEDVATTLFERSESLQEFLDIILQDELYTLPELKNIFKSPDKIVDEEYSNHKKLKTKSLDFKYLMKIDNDRYRIACDCIDPYCDFQMYVEPMTGGLWELNIYKNINWDSEYYSKNIFETFWNRIKASFELLFTGRIEMEGSFVLNKENTRSFIHALEEIERRMKD